MPPKEKPLTPDAPLQGIILRGVCRARTRRAITGRDGKTRYLVTVVVAADGERYAAETWSATPLPPGLPQPGENCQFAVGVRVFLAGGTPQYRLTFGDTQTDESF